MSNIPKSSLGFLGVRFSRTHYRGDEPMTHNLKYNHVLVKGVRVRGCCSDAMKNDIILGFPKVNVKATC